MAHHLTSIDIVAHPDDDLIFQSPTLLGDVTAGSCVTTLIVTAGDAGQGMGYASDRENGSNAAYANMASISPDYYESYATFGGQRVLLRTSNKASRMQRIFMRLPDGNMPGTGFSVNG